MAVTQEVEQLVWQLGGCWFSPVQLAVPSVVDSAISVWMCSCEALIVQHFKMATGQKCAKSNAIHSAFTITGSVFFLITDNKMIK